MPLLYEEYAIAALNEYKELAQKAEPHKKALKEIEKRMSEIEEQLDKWAEMVGGANKYTFPSDPGVCYNVSEYDREIINPSIKNFIYEFDTYVHQIKDLIEQSTNDTLKNFIRQVPNDFRDQMIEIKRIRRHNFNKF